VDSAVVVNDVADGLEIFGLEDRWIVETCYYYGV